MVKKKEVRAYPDEENGSFCQDSLDIAIAASVRSPLPQHDFLARKTPDLHRSSCDRSCRLLYVMADIRVGR